MTKKTLKASELVSLIEKSIKEYGDLHVYLSSGTGEVPITNSRFKFSNKIGAKKTKDDSEMETLSGRFFVITDL